MVRDKAGKVEVDKKMGITERGKVEEGNMGKVKWKEVRQKEVG